MKITEQIYARLYEISQSATDQNFTECCIGWMNDLAYKELRKETSNGLPHHLLDMPHNLGCDFIYCGVRFLIIPVGRHRAVNRPALGIEYVGDRY